MYRSIVLILPAVHRFRRKSPKIVRIFVNHDFISTYEQNYLPKYRFSRHFGTFSVSLRLSTDPKRFKMAIFVIKCGILLNILATQGAIEMATYLWIGKDFAYPSASVNTPQQRLDKYCFNEPTNWKVKNSAGTQWTTATQAPSGGDVVIVGCEFGASGQEIPNWQAAKCPLFFGGYSGGEGLGTWSHTGPTYTTGTTWTNALVEFKVDINKGWCFDVPVGGGLTGLNLLWAIAKDSEAGTQTDASFYVASNSSGFRNPSSDLRLKVSKLISFKDKTDSTFPTIYSSITGLPVPNLTPYVPFDPIFTRFASRGFKFSGVRSFFLYSGMTGNGIVDTRVEIDAGYGQDIKISGGFYDYVGINNNVVSIAMGSEFGGILDGRSHFGNLYAPGQFPSSDSPQTRYLYYFEYGDISIDNVVAREIEYAKCDYVNINGGTAARILVHMQAYGAHASSGYDTKFLNEPGSPETLLRYDYQLPTGISCNFNGLAAFSAIKGVTNATQIPEGYNGVLELDDKPCSMYLKYPSGYGVGVCGGSGNVAQVGSYSDMLYNQHHSWRSHNCRTNLPSQPVNLGQPTQEVILYNNVASGAIPLVKINCVSSADPSTGRLTGNWKPWALKLASPSGCLINKIENYGGFIRRHRTLELVTPQPSFRIGECVLGRFGALDFDRAQTPDQAPVGNYIPADFRVGGISGGYLQGGIKMADPTGRIIGGANVHILPTFVKANLLTYGFGATASAALPEKLIPYNPTSSTP
jgi:hypothetical protein